VECSAEKDHFSSTDYADSHRLFETASAEIQHFGDYLAELRVQYKQKRNFIKLLDGSAGSITGVK